MGGELTAETGASDQLRETHFPEEFPRVGDSGQEVSASQGKKVEALQGEDPTTCHMTSLIPESCLALGLHFEDEEAGSERCHQLLKGRAV